MVLERELLQILVAQLIPEVSALEFKSGNDFIMHFNFNLNFALSYELVFQ